MRTRKSSISGLMWVVLFSALVLAVARGDPGFRLLARYGVLIGAGLLAFQWIWFIQVPKLSLRLAVRDRASQRRLLLWVVNTPFPSGPKVFARYLLAVNRQVSGELAAAEADFRSILREGGDRLDPGFASHLHQHLADTLESAGRKDEAEAERRLATESLRGSQPTILSLQSKGNLLERENRHAEAHATYREALTLAATSPKSVQSELVMQLVLSAFNAGRPAAALGWAEKLLEHDPDSIHRDGATRMAALACGSLGRHGDAVRYARLASERASSGDQRAEALGLLADYLMRRGELAEAERVAREADSLAPGKKRLPTVVLALIAKEQGRTEEALALFLRVANAPVGHIPALNRRAAAASQLTEAFLLAELGHHEKAIALLSEAEAVLRSDPAQSVILDATASLVHAFRGERAEAIARIDTADARRREFPDAGTIQRGCLSFICRAALKIGELERAETLLRAYLDAGPDPLYLPYGYSLLGDCCRRLGDIEGGREWDRKAASTSFGSRWERASRERLEAEGVTT